MKRVFIALFCSVVVYGATSTEEIQNKRKSILNEFFEDHITAGVFALNKMTADMRRQVLSDFDKVYGLPITHTFLISDKYIIVSNLIQHFPETLSIVDRDDNALAHLLGYSNDESDKFLHIAQKILEGTPDLHVKNKRGEIPFDVAKQEKRHKLIKVFESVENSRVALEQFTHALFQLTD